MRRLDDGGGTVNKTGSGYGGHLKVEKKEIKKTLRRRHKLNGTTITDVLDRVVLVGDVELPVVDVVVWMHHQGSP